MLNLKFAISIVADPIFNESDWLINPAKEWIRVSRVINNTITHNDGNRETKYVQILSEILNIDFVENFSRLTPSHIFFADSVSTKALIELSKCNISNSIIYCSYIHKKYSDSYQAIINFDINKTNILQNETTYGRTPGRIDSTFGNLPSKTLKLLIEFYPNKIQGNTLYSNLMEYSFVDTIASNACLTVEERTQLFEAFGVSTNAIP